MIGSAGTLVRAELRARHRALLALCGGTFVFLLAIAGTYTALGGATGLARSFGARPPAFFSAFAGTRNTNLFTPHNFVGFGFAHPLFLVLTLTVGISIGTASVAGDIETGRVELLYTRPIRRTSLLDARLGVWVVARLSVVAAGVAGSWLGTRLSHDLGDVGPGLYARVAAQYLPLAALLGAVAFVASSTSRTRGHALAVTVGVAALAYLVKFVALLWHPFAWAPARHAVRLLLPARTHRCRASCPYRAAARQRGRARGRRTLVARTARSRLARRSHAARSSKRAVPTSPRDRRAGAAEPDQPALFCSDDGADGVGHLGEAR